MNYNDTYQLLIRYIDGETSALEKEQMESLLNTQPAWKQEYENLIQINKILAKQHTVDSDVQGNWAMFEKSIDTKISKRFFLPSYYKYAAAAVFIILAGLYFLLPSHTPHFAEGKLYKTGHNEIIHISLPDGSAIALNENSSLQLDENFNEETRSVELKGSAFFEVVGNKEKPFIAYANSTQTKVLGTSFFLQNRKQNQVQLKLYTGRVDFITDTKTETLKKGEELDYTANSGELSKKTLTASLREPWTHTGLSFNDESLNTIVSKLQSAYSIKVQIPDNMKQVKYTASFNGLDLQSALALMEELTDSKITLKDSIYVLIP